MSSLLSLRAVSSMACRASSRVYGVAWWSDSRGESSRDRKFLRVCGAFRSLISEMVTGRVVLELSCETAN